MSQLASLFSDGYELKARFYPMALLITPFVFTVFVILSVPIDDLKTMSTTILVSYGGIYLLKQLARDLGKKKETLLFKRWGGLPSVLVLRHRDTEIDHLTKANFHNKLAQLVEGTTAPTKEQERDDPEKIDDTYVAWSNFLRINTRSEEFALVQKELTNYGYRRNICGLRPIGISISILSVFVCLLHFYYNSAHNEITLSAIVVNFVFAGLWIFRFTDNWVWITALEYAKRLVESTDQLSRKYSN